MRIKFYFNSISYRREFRFLISFFTTFIFLAIISKFIFVIKYKTY